MQELYNQDKREKMRERVSLYVALALLIIYLAVFCSFNDFNKEYHKLKKEEQCQEQVKTSTN